jgi:chaperonin GroES
MADIKFKPLHSFIVVRLDPAPQPSSFLSIPDHLLEKATEGEVVAVGPGKRLPDGTREALSVTVGDRVMLGKGSGKEIEPAGEKLLLIREDDVMGILTQ